MAWMTMACHQLDHCVGGDIDCNPLSILALANVPPRAGTVTALYAGAPNINDYIANDGSSFLNASGSTCLIGGSGWGTCLHASLIRTADLGGATSCSNYSISDSLDALQWYCDDSTGVARAVSAGLKPEVALSTVIDFDTGTFKPMSVIVSTGLLSSTSAAQTFWNNPLVVDNDGMNPGDTTSGTIYLISQDPQATYFIDAAKVGLISRPGVLITGTIAGSETIIDVSANHAWIEGSINLTGDGIAVQLNGSSFSVVRNASAQNCSAGSSVFHLTVTSRSNYLGDLRIADPVNCTGIQIDTNSAYNIFERVIASNSGSNFIRQQSSSVRNTFLDLTAFTAGANVIANIGVPDLAIINATMVGTNSRGVSATGGGDHLLLQNIATVNHNFHGIEFNSSSTNRVINLLSDFNNNNGVEINNGSNNTFAGELKLNSNSGSNCNITGGTAPGLITTSCTDSGADGSSTYTGQTSTAILRTNQNSGASFIGNILSEDAMNNSDSSGAQIFDSISDWLNFDNRYRSWARNVTGINNSTLRTSCFTGISCGIHDFSLSANDIVLRNANAIVSSGGSSTHTFNDASSHTFLHFATEILMDGYGDEDGFCESNERCLYAPNIGAYQGHGSIISAGTINSGTVTNVSLFQYANNGR